MTKPTLKLVPRIPSIAKYRQVPLRRPNKELRSREYLTPTEIEAMLDAARRMRQGHRHATMLLIAYRHGFRAAEVVDLRWDQIDPDQARLVGASVVRLRRSICRVQRHFHPAAL